MTAVLEEFDKKYYLYAGLIGAVAGVYVVYRTKSSSKENTMKVNAKKQGTEE